MRIGWKSVNRVLVLSVAGRLTTPARAAQLRQTIDDVVRDGHRQVVLDVRRLRDVDRPGLATITTCLRAVRGAGGDLKLASVARRVSTLVAVSGILRVADVFDTVPAAVRAFDHDDAHPAAVNG